MATVSVSCNQLKITYLMLVHDTVPLRRCIVQSVQNRIISTIARYSGYFCHVPSGVPMSSYSVVPPRRSTASFLRVVPPRCSLCRSLCRSTASFPALFSRRSPHHSLRRSPASFPVSFPASFPRHIPLRRSRSTTSFPVSFPASFHWAVPLRRDSSPRAIPLCRSLVPPLYRVISLKSRN